jgi:hypothetical protein
MFSFKFSYLGVSKSIVTNFFDTPVFDKKCWKMAFVPYDHYMKSIFDKCLADFSENNLLDHLRYIIFFSVINEKIYKKFGSVTLPLLKVYDLLYSDNKVFVFLKDYKTFHIIIRNTLSVFLEIVNIQTINIYSSYLWNYHNCCDFMDSLLGNNEMVSKSISGNGGESNRKLIILANNEQSSLLRDVDKILDHIEKFITY